MTTNATIRQTISEAIAEVPRLIVYAYPDVAILVPAAVVAGLEMTESTLGGGRDLTAKVLVVVSRSHVSQLQLLDELLDESGTGSIVAAINDHIADGVSVMVESVGSYGEFAWGDVSYYGAVVTVKVFT